MKNILLLGAGFSRNWGGWLSKELIGDLLTRVKDESFISNSLQHAENFEDIIGYLHSNVIDGNTPERYKRYMDEVKSSFRAMNKSYKQKNFEFSQDVQNQVRAFLGKFDAIFTLNQDLLLEIHLNSTELLNPTIGKSPYFPGVKPPENWRIGEGNSSNIDEVWSVDSQNISFESNAIPIVKLHGSINWKDESNDDLLVIGNNKYNYINQSPLLSKYQKFFEDTLSTPDTRLMVIGYSFSDSHINNIIMSSWQRSNFGMFIVDPNGNKNIQGQLNSIQLIGISSRPLSETFKSDNLELNKLNSFFN